MASWADKEKAILSLERNGKVDPLDLIEAAKASDHPCHDDFTWDIEQAAAERWRDQARALIRQVHFEIQVQEATERVVMYVPNDGDEHQFQSLPKIRSKAAAGTVLGKEVAMLLGVADRVYKIALAKWNLVGDEAVATLRKVRDTVSSLKDDL